jgi:phosphate transport system permease protein
MVETARRPTASQTAPLRMTGIERIRPRSFHRRDGLVLGGALVSSLALTWLLYAQLLPFGGLQGALLMWAGTFLLVYYIAVRELDGPVLARDRTMAALVTTVAVGVAIPLVIIIVYVTIKGARFLRLSFFTQDLANIGPQDPPEQSGGLHAIIGTVMQVGIAMLISVPLGVLTAVYLNEVRGRLRVPVRIFVDSMSGVPSIVAGLFIFTMLVSEGGGFSGFAAALALSVLMLPTVTRTSEVVLRLVPGGLREASLALGSPEWRTVWRVVLPAARTGIITAVLLGIARVVGETAPLIFTSFGSSVTNINPFSGAQASLPLSSFKLFQQFDNDVNRAWTFAFVLIAIVLILFVLARRLGRRQLGSR